MADPKRLEYPGKKGVTMFLDDALRRIGEESAIPAFPIELRERDFIRRADDPDFTPEVIGEYARYAQIEPDAILKMEEILRKMENSLPLRTVAQAVFRTVFLIPDTRKKVGWTEQCPTFRASAGILSGALLLCIAAAAVPRIRHLHQRLNVPEEITRHTCGILSSISKNAVFFTGEPGITLIQLEWLRHYLQEHLHYFQIGRFGFMTKKNNLPLTIYRDRKSGEDFAFVHAGIPLCTDGFGGDETDAAFHSVFEIQDGILRANRIGPDGHAERTPMLFNLNHAECVLGSDTPILDMHIPAGGGMTPDIAEKSFREAEALYKKLLPEQDWPKAVLCCSWIFNPSLPDILPPEANLNRLLAMVHPVPVASGRESGLNFIFRQPGPFDPAAAPRKTSLQRAVADWIQGGGRWRVGGMYRLIES